MNRQVSFFGSGNELLKFDFDNKKYGAVLEGELYRIYAKRTFRIKRNGKDIVVKKGSKGGLINEQKNLSPLKTCWVFDDAKVLDNAFVEDEAIVRGNAVVKDNAIVAGSATVEDNAVVRGSAVVYGASIVKDNAVVKDYAEVDNYVVVKGSAKIGGDRKLNGKQTITK